MRKLSTLSSLLLVLTLLLAACGAAPAATTPTTAPAPTTAAAPTAAPAPTTAAATAVPATAVAATAVPATTEIAAATAAPATTVMPKPVVNTLTVKLRAGLKWSDGTPLTAQDFAGTYDLMWAKDQGGGSWAFLSDVVAKDDTTIEFAINTPSPRLLRLLLRSNQAAPRSQYGTYMDQAHALRMKNADPKGDDVKKVADDLLAFKPDDAVTYGPFKMDPSAVTEAQLALVKNPSGFNADKVGFEKIIVYYGETAASVPLVLSGELDYSSHGFTPADLKSFETLPNVEIIRGPTGTGPGLWFNESLYPLNCKEVRQAFAYIIDRAENATVALGESASRSPTWPASATSWCRSGSRRK